MEDDIKLIIQAIDEYLVQTGKTFCEPPEANCILEKKGILKNHKVRSGQPLRKLLRKGLIPHAYQIGGKGSLWHIPSSKSNETNYIEMINNISEENNRSYAFAPLLGDNPKILILGTLPGKESLRTKEYYSCRSNRIWKVLAKILDWKEPSSYEDKKKMLFDNGIALWDVLYSAEREGSSDCNIMEEKANQIDVFIQQHPSITTIAFNGKTPEKMYWSHIGKQLENVRMLTLLSSSPSNMKYSDIEMNENWKQLIED